MTTHPVASTADLAPGEGIPKPQNTLEAAQQFEALLLGQMLQTMHASEESEDPTNDTMWDMAAQQFAQVLSKNGGLGLSKLIARGLEPKPPESGVQLKESVSRSSHVFPSIPQGIKR
jgi:Rod binding domain-containing protein